MTLFEVDEAATRIREEVGDDADIIVGAIFDETLEGKFKVSVVATGLEAPTTEADLTVIMRGQAEQIHVVQ